MEPSVPLLHSDNLNFSPWRECVVETAAAGQPTSLPPGDSYTITDREIIFRPGQGAGSLRQDGNLESLGLKPSRCCSGLHEEREDAPSQWKINGDTQFDLWSSTPHLPSVEAGEQIAVGKFTPTFEFTLPGYGEFLPTEGEEGEIRFDGAAYNPWAKIGSVFPDATPSLRYDKSDTSHAGSPAA
ncbi:hypothetical protein [Streptomyces niveus]|uniref:hypothetical protein n=1 Tax=Streptomyces niveus TaxID=193462 RepID=UPI000A6DEDDA|nr:hypothetical protein [Streptomyces niveus]